MGRNVARGTGIATPPATGAPYCTLEEAQAAGATGTDDAINDAIAAAGELIDRYCQEWFSTRTATVTAEIDRRGVIRLPRRLQAVTSAAYLDTGAAMAATSYRTLLGTTPGSADALELLSTWPAINSGWMDDDRYDARVTVTGTFGYTAIPFAVRRAAALLAAWLTTSPTLASQTAGVSSLSVEGYSVTFDSSSTSDDTTGLSAADALLKPYRRVADYDSLPIG